MRLAIQRFVTLAVVVLSTTPALAKRVVPTDRVTSGVTVRERATAGAGLRVAFQCSNDGSRRLITEMRISLRGDIDGSSDVGDLIMAAGPVDRGCTNGTIDPVGLQ